MSAKLYPYVHTYVQTLSAEKRDRVIEAVAFCPGWWEERRGIGCLVMTAECADLTDQKSRRAVLNSIGSRALVHGTERELAYLAAMEFTDMYHAEGHDYATAAVKMWAGEKHTVRVTKVAPAEPALGRFLRQARARVHMLASLFF